MSNDSKPERAKLIVGVSGASGAIFAKRMLVQVAAAGVDSHLVVSKAARRTIQLELGEEKDALGTPSVEYSPTDIAAPIASGSFETCGMIVAPCSVKTMSEIATGMTSSLLTRAADVCLKERRPLVLMVRETPLHLGHLRTMTQLAEIGAIIAPPLPAFYTEPASVEALVDQSVARALQLVGIESPYTKRWGEDLPSKSP